jgi:hypothetical protein
MIILELSLSGVTISWCQSHLKSYVLAVLYVHLLYGAFEHIMW